MAQRGAVLVVDDNKVSREILARSLGLQGHSTTTAVDGKEALAFIDENNFDLILLDILMPEMNGFEVLEKLKQNSNARNIPVIVISALDDMESLVRGISLGADDYLTKPFNDILLKARVNATLEKKFLLDKEQAYLMAEKERAEVALKETEERLDTVVSSTPIFLFTFNKEGTITLSEGKSLSKLGLKPGALVGKSVFEVFPNSEYFHQQAQRAIHGEELIGILEIDNMAWEVQYTPVRDVNEETSYVIGVAYDITERKRANEERERLFKEIVRSNRQLKELSKKLLKTQENERRAIAKELHDEIGQSVTGLKISLELSMQSLGDKSPPFLKEAGKIAVDLVEMVREMSLRLRPTMLDDLGIVSALKWLFERYTKQTGIRVNFDFYNVERRFDTQVETAIYRIIQESLTNIARYAKVEEVDIRLFASENKMGLVITDKGIGFDPTIVLNSNSSSGLAGMIERAKLLGGDLVIESAPGNGTRLDMEIPLSENLSET